MNAKDMEDFSGRMAALEAHRSTLEEINARLGQELLVLPEEFRKALEVIQDETRNLKLGIIGQIKAGKSSFLNELLFRGRSILPKASTPMTAALTVLRYGSGFRGLIEFYSKDDVNDFRKLNDRVLEKIKDLREESRREMENYRRRAAGASKVEDLILPEDLSEKSDQEIVGGQGADLFSDLETAAWEICGKLKEIPDLEARMGRQEEKIWSGLEELQKDLMNYVGAEGAYTPLVKKVELTMEVPELEGYDLVDTPGLNDPVISRGLVTKKALKNCDSVVVLSVANRFMDAKDQDLMRLQLPGEGIRSMQLLGGKLDSVLIDHNVSNPMDFPSALKTTLATLEKTAAEALQKMTRNSPEGSILRSLENHRPLMISTYFRQFARHKTQGEELSSDARHTYKRLYEEFSEAEVTPEVLDKNSGFAALEEYLASVKAAAGEVKRTRLQDLSREKLLQAQELTRQITEALEARINLIRNASLTEIQSNLSKQQKDIECCSEEIKSVFLALSPNLVHAVDGLILDLKKRTVADTRVEITTTKKSETYTVEKSGLGSGIARFFGFGGYETRTREVTIRSADVLTAVEKLQDAILDINKTLKEFLWNLLGDGLRKHIVNSVWGVIEPKLNMSRPDFSAAGVLNPLHETVNSLQLAQIRLDPAPYILSIQQQFSGQVFDGEAEKFAWKIKEVQEDIMTQLSNDLYAYRTKLLASLDKLSGEFTSRLLDSMKEEKARLEMQLQEKSKALSRLEALSAAVKAL